MARVEGPSVSHPELVAFGARLAEHSIVWLIGEHDVSTVSALSEVMARAIALDDADLVVDLSGVEFLDASTIGVIARSASFLRHQSRSLLVRAPSPSTARRLLHLCGLAELLEPHSIDVTHALGDAGALGTWVAVPRSNRPEAELPTDVQPAVEARVTSVVGPEGP